MSIRLRRLPLIAGGLLVLAVPACGTGPSAETPAQSSDAPVCGLVSPALVRRLVGDDAIDTRGEGITSRAERARQPSTCDVVDADLTRTMLSVSVGEVTDRSRWRGTLDHDAADTSGHCVRYRTDPGHGYGCTYDRGLFVDGATVDVLRGGRLISISIMGWVDANPAQRLALAEDIARDVDSHVTAYDDGNG